MDKKTLRVLALAGAVSGASLLTSGPAAAAPIRWECREDLPPGPSFRSRDCSYSQYPMQAPATAPNINPAPKPDPGPGPSPGPYTA